MTNKNPTVNQENNAFTSLIGLVFVFLIIALLNVPVLITIWENSFDDGTYSHAYLIPFISMFLYYKLAKTGQLTYRSKLSSIPLLLLVFSAAFFFIMSTAQISLGYWAGLLAILLSGVLLIYRTNWQVLFPSLFLVFLFPGWGLLTALLQKVAVSAVTFLMSFTGIPTFVEGNFVTIPAGVFEIADGCSGLRYLIVSLAISSLFNFLYIKNIRKAVLFFAVAILGALITNWIRITALILIGEYTDMQSSLMTDHNTFGWYLYAPFMVILFMWGNKLADNDQLSVEITSNSAESKLYPAVVNSLALLFIIVISSTSIKTLTLSNSNISHTPTTMPSITPVINNYSHLELVPDTGNTLYLKYFFNGAIANGKPTAHYNNFIPVDWRSVQEETVGLWKYITIVNKNNVALVRYTFEINGQRTASSGAFKKQRLIAALKGNSETYLHWQFIACTSNCEQEKIH